MTIQQILETFGIQLNDREATAASAVREYPTDSLAPMAKMLAEHVADLEATDGDALELRDAKRMLLHVQAEATRRGIK